MATRRSFLQSSAAIAAALSAPAPVLDARAGARAAQPSLTDAPSPKAGSEVQVPKMKFFDVEISRMVLGVNPFCGYAHYNNNFSGAMKDWYTPERVCAVMHQCERFGINALIQDGGVEPAFRTAFSSIKPTDGIVVGMFPRAKDEVRENAEIVLRILQS